MNTFDLVLVIPTLLTVVSASTLYFSFRGRVDASGRLFLLAELLWLFALLIVMAINIQASFGTTLIFFVLSVVTFLSEVAILFSIRALTQKVQLRELIYWIIFVFVYSALTEYCRNYISPKLSVLFFSLFSFGVTSITYVICKRINNNGLENNLFIKWIAYVEIGLAIIHVLRFASYFSDVPVKPLNPTSLAIIVFSIWMSINFFRYFSYLALRVSWIDPRAINENPLNQNIVKLSLEKDRFLQGLISSNRALGISALANSLAHQLSQPITGIIFQTETVRRELINRGEQGKSVQILQTVTEQLDKVSSLINNLRKLIGSHDLELKPFDVQEACDEVLEIIKPTLELKNILLTKSSAVHPVAMGNPIQIQ